MNIKGQKNEADRIAKLEARITALESHPSSTKSADKTYVKMSMVPQGRWFVLERGVNVGKVLGTPLPCSEHESIVRFKHPDGKLDACGRSVTVCLLPADFEPAPSPTYLERLPQALRDKIEQDIKYNSSGTSTGIDIEALARAICEAFPDAIALREGGAA